MLASHILRHMQGALLAAVCCLGLDAYTQSRPVESLGLREGLPQSQVKAVAQDAEGYLWVGTWGGLARFDGRSFTVFHLGENLPSERIMHLLADHSGALWVAMFKGLSVYRDHRLQVVDSPLFRNIQCNALCEDGSGRVWVATVVGPVVMEGGAFRSAGGEAQGKVTTDLLRCPDGVLVATRDGLVLYGLDGSSRRVTAPAIRSGYIKALARTGRGLWLGTAGNGLWLRDARGWQPVSETEIPGRFIVRISLTPSGILCVATSDRGLFLLRPGSTRFEAWDNSNGLPSNHIACAFEDRESNLWVGTDGTGLVRLVDAPVENFTPAQGLPGVSVFGVTPSQWPKTIWVGTIAGAALFQVAPRPKVMETVTSKDGLPNELVTQAIETPDHTLWLQTLTGIAIRPPGAKRLSVPRDLPLAPTDVFEEVLDSEHRLWLGGRAGPNALALRESPGRWKLWGRADEGEPVISCFALARRREGGVWLATSNRVLFCDGNRLHALPRQPPLAGGSSPTCLFEDSRGRLWAGSEAGLAVLEATGRWRSFDQDPRFLNRHVYFIGEDYSGTVWIGTAKGVAVVRPDNSVMTLLPRDGLPDYETNRSGFFADPDGSVWIGTIGGLCHIRPSIWKNNPVPPRAVIEEVDLPDRKIPYPTALRIGWRERSLMFRTAVLSLRDPIRSAYRARLDGLEENWLPLRQEPELRYTSLPPGRYEFLAQAVNESGVWGEVVSLPVEVRPPVWRTGWFEALALFSLLAAALGVHRWRLRLLRYRTAELEALVAERSAGLINANERLSHLARHDSLTGLMNRRAILEILEGALEAEHGRKVGVLLVDLDHFKKVNDQLGHNAGDTVLRDFSKAILGSMREGDSLGRHGGDEFLVVMPGADAEAVGAVGKRIAALSLTLHGGLEPITVTTSSGGVALKGAAHRDSVSVLSLADDMLYQAKQRGRHTFAMHELSD